MSGYEAGPESTASTVRPRSTLSVARDDERGPSPQRAVFDPVSKLRMRPRCGSFEKLDVDNPVKLVRSGKEKKVDPLKKKRDRSDFRVCGKNANAAFEPPNFDPSMFNLPDSGMEGLSLGIGPFGGGDEQMQFGTEYNSNTEVSESDYTSEFDALGMMSPAGDGALSDASHLDYAMFRDDRSVGGGIGGGRLPGAGWPDGEAGGHRLGERRRR